MSHTVAVGEFKGPLGLLLELVERHKLEVTQVSVGDITSEYIQKIQALEEISADELSEFLQLGARLLYIKSLALLPEAGSAEQDQELARLNLELAEYRQFQAAARLLAARGSVRTWQRPAAPPLPASELPLPALTLPQLADAFTRALKLAPQAPATTILTPHISLAAVTAKLRGRLPEGFDLHTVIEECRDRLEIVVTFLAVLELVRSGAALVTQASQFNPIRVEAAHG